MKTLHDLLKEISEQWKDIRGVDSSSTETDYETYCLKERLRDLIKTEDMFLGYYSDKLNLVYMNVSLSETLDEMIKSRKNTSGLSLDTDDIKQYFTVKYFIEADDATKENIISNETLNGAIVGCDECYLRFIDPKWFRKLWDKRPSDTSSNIWHKLMCIEDFDNVSDEDVVEVATSKCSAQGTSYGIACTLFGEDRVVSLITEYVKGKVKASQEKIFQYDVCEEQGSLLEKILLKLDDETVKGCYPASYRESGYLKLCQKDPRYLIHAQNFLEEDANAIWDTVSENNDLIRYCAIIAKCCYNRNIPSYQLAKIKVFAPLLQMYAYNYKSVFEAIKGSFNPDGSIKEEVLNLAKNRKAVKVDQIYYCVIKDGNIQIFKSEEEGTAANIEGGINYNFNKVQLNKKMNELLGN